MMQSVQSFSKKVSEGIYKLSQEWSLKNQSTFQIVMLKLLKSFLLSKRLYQRMIVFTSILTLGSMTQKFFWTQYAFSLVPVLVGIFFWTIFLWLLVALQAKMKDEP